MKTSRKNKSRCTAVPEPCVQLCIRRKFRSCAWSLHTLHSWTLTSEPSAILTTRCSDELERDWKRKFLKMERQFSVGPPLEVDHFDRKIFTWAEPFHLRLDRNFWKFGIMEAPQMSWFAIRQTFIIQSIPYIQWHTVCVLHLVLFTTIQYNRFLELHFIKLWRVKLKSGFVTLASNRYTKR